MKLYYLLGQLMAPFAKVAFYLYSRVTGTKRVRVIVKSEDGSILFLKTWLGANEWGLPGGGAERGESLEMAATRELREETGIRIVPEKLERLFSLESMGHEEVIFAVDVPAGSLPPVVPNRFEVKEAIWLPLDQVDRLDSLAERVFRKVAPKR